VSDQAGTGTDVVPEDAEDDVKFSPSRGTHGLIDGRVGITSVETSMERDVVTLTVTSRGRVTLRQDVLRHLGTRPGEKIELVLLRGGRAELKAARPRGTIDDFIGLLAGKTNRVLSLKQMNEIAAAGWAVDE
jgi:bifunctional DNA-binding transcriptional regulator/antitoxin component of YhaV-PrlF toxin-antitoxin module